MAVATALLNRREASFDPLEIRSAPGQVAFVAGSVTRSPPKAATARAGALRVDILGEAFKECEEPLRIADAPPERFPKCFVGLAYRALPGIQFIGARLTLVQFEARVKSRACGSFGHFSAVQCRPVISHSRPMYVLSRRAASRIGMRQSQFW